MVIPAWALWTAGAAGAYALYERVVKKEAHPFTSPTTIPGRLRAKAIDLVKTSVNPTQLRALGTALAQKGDSKVAAAAQNKAAAIEAQQAPFAAAVSQVATAPIPPTPTPGIRGPVVLTPSSSAPSSPAPSSPGPIVIPPTIRRGSGIAPKPPDANVRRAQTLLGPAAGIPDGRFGAKTEAAAKVFQAGRGLTADGIIGPKTWAVLLSSTGGV